MPKKRKSHHTETSAAQVLSSVADVTQRKFWWIVTALLCCGLLLRLWGIARQEVWMDEAFASLITQLDRDQFMAALRLESNPPLYFLALKIFCSIFGHSAVALRAPSILFSIAAIAVVAVYGARLFGRSFGVAAGAFLTLSPYSIYYAQEARTYSLMILLVIIALLAVYDAVKNNSSRAVWWVALAVLAAGYAHYFAALALLPMIVWLSYEFVRRADRRRIIGWLFIALTLDAAICAAWMLPRVVNRNANPQLWIAEQWEHLDKVWVIPKSLLVLILGSAQGFTPLFLKQLTLLKQPVVLGVLAALACAKLFVSAIFANSSKAIARPAVGWGLLASVLLPLTLLFVVSFFKPLYVVGRYDIIGFPFVVLLVGWTGVRSYDAQGGPRAVYIVAALILGSCLIYKDVMFLNSPRVYQDYDAEKSAALIDTALDDHDLIVFTGMRGTSVLYYLTQLGYQWDGATCKRSEHPITVQCRMLPYSDSGVPFVMGTPVTTPVTPDSAIHDITPQIAETVRRKGKVVLAISRLRSQPGEAIDRQLERVLARSGFGPSPFNSTLLPYRIFIHSLAGSIGSRAASATDN